jgi:hypothetical protein
MPDTTSTLAGRFRRAGFGRSTICTSQSNAVKNRNNRPEENPSSRPRISADTFG